MIVDIYIYIYARVCVCVCVCDRNSFLRHDVGNTPEVSTVILDKPSKHVHAEPISFSTADCTV